MHSRVSTGRFWVVFAFLMALFMLAGCAGGNKQSEIVPADEGILRVGVSTDYPPLIYKENDEIVGAEADLARAFAEYLGRKPVFVEIAWENQIDALKADQTDIIMSGMSVTEERLYQIAFSKAYFRTGQLVLVGAKEKLKHLNNYAALEAQVVALEVGVVTGTTGEGWAREYLRSAGGIVRFKTAAEALQALKSFKIDIMVHDGVSILMLQATSGGSGLKMIPMFFTEEYLAWGLRKSDDTLLKSTNSFLEQIKRDGTLKQILSKWIPNISDLQ